MTAGKWSICLCSEPYDCWEHSGGHGVCGHHSHPHKTLYPASHNMVSHLGTTHHVMVSVLIDKPFPDNATQLDYCSCHELGYKPHIPSWFSETFNQLQNDACTMVVTICPIRFATWRLRSMIFTYRRAVQFLCYSPVLQQSKLLEASLTTPVAIPPFEFEVALPLQNNTIIISSVSQNGMMHTEYHFGAYDTHTSGIIGPTSTQMGSTCTIPSPNTQPRCFNYKLRNGL